MMSRHSIVEFFSQHSGYSCGYCKSEDTNISHGMWGHHLTVQDYEDLINRGWRRSGVYCYKPTMQSTCCPQYTISCKVLKFKLSKSQKKLLKRVNHYLAHGRNLHDKEPNQGRSVMDQDEVMDDGQSEKIVLPIQKPSTNKEIFSDMHDLCSAENDQSMPCESVGDTKSCDISSPEHSCMKMKSKEGSHVKKSPNVVKNLLSTMEGIDPLRPPCRKAKEIRRERYLQKLSKLQGEGALDVNKELTKNRKSLEKSLEEFLESPATMSHKLDIRLVPATLSHPSFASTLEESYSVYQKYQITIHKDPPDKCTKKQFIKFLVDNPFSSTDDVPEQLSGSYHQQYWLDGRLVAVGVIDILPHCVSSVYLYYDPEYNFLSLGTYAALREIAFTRELHKEHPSIEYYYMGFYIHSCPKMTYKGQYFPSYLLCPEAYTFQSIEKCIRKLNVSKYHRLDDSDKKDTEGIVHLEEVMILYMRQIMRYPLYRAKSKQIEDEAIVREYANLIGRKSYRTILLYRS